MSMKLLLLVEGLLPAHAAHGSTSTIRSTSADPYALLGDGAHQSLGSSDANRWLAVRTYYSTQSNLAIIHLADRVG